MQSQFFLPADILIPREADMTKWSVVACDQFTSEPEYWARVDERVGGAPSTLRLVLPEAWLGTQGAGDGISETMREYLSGGVFREVNDSFVLVRRELPGGAVRTGLLGAVDLERYDYHDGAKSLLRATEGTVEERLPPRVAIRRQSPLELPHIVIFYDDPHNSVLGELSDVAQAETLYDFDLMEGGGHITGTRICGEAAARLEAALERLGEPEAMRERYGSAAALQPPVFAMGDGNHSLAAAKLCWEELKPALAPEEREGHPARYALAELVNIRDDSIVFEPIHRVLFDTDCADFSAAAERFLAAVGGEGAERTLCRVCGSERGEIAVAGLTEGEIIAAADRFLAGYAVAHGGHVDYIHGDATASALASKPGCAGILLPVPDKSRLFASIAESGVFPRKSFSVGHAAEKRYYLECRKIKP